MDPITGLKSAPLDERLKYFDQELRKLYKSCKAGGYDADKIRETALPVMHAARRGSWKTRAKRSLIVVAALCVFASLFAFPPTFYMIRVATKKFMVSAVLPYYDWTWPFMADCVIDNPYYMPEDDSLTEQDCEVCQDIKALEVKKNVSTDSMVQDIFDMIPTLVGDSMDDWRAMTDHVTFDDFVKIHLNKDFMMNEENYCSPRVTSGFAIPNVTTPALMKYLDEENKLGKKTNFTATWVNCHVDTFKEVHRLYFKPYFIPGMCEPTQHKNYVLMGRKSENKTKALFLKERFGELGIWVAQIYGQFEMLIQPIPVCKKSCQNLRFNLTVGQVVNIPTTLYNIAFRPSTEEALAIAVAYSYT